MVDRRTISPFNATVDYKDYTPRNADVFGATQTVVKHAPAEDRALLLSALGFTPYVRAVNPDARDKVMHTRGNDAACKRGHSRIDHGVRDKDGYWMCRTCRREAEARRRKKAADE